jgi:hypothetical protein
VAYLSADFRRHPLVTASPMFWSSTTALALRCMAFPFARMTAVNSRADHDSR